MCNWFPVIEILVLKFFKNMFWLSHWRYVCQYQDILPISYSGFSDLEAEKHMLLIWMLKHNHHEKLSQRKVVHAFNPRRERKSDLWSWSAWDRSFQVQNTIDPDVVVHTLIWERFSAGGIHKVSERRKVSFFYATACSYVLAFSPNFLPSRI